MFATAALTGAALWARIEPPRAFESGVRSVRTSNFGDAHLVKSGNTTRECYDLAGQAAQDWQIAPGINKSSVLEFRAEFYNLANHRTLVFLMIAASKLSWPGPTN